MIVELNGKEAGLTFECMHIVPGRGDCSRIHPHFHYVDVLIDGEFDDKRRIVHLYNLKAVIKRICSTFEDKILIADYPESVQRVAVEEQHYRIEINGKMYLIPKADIFKIKCPSLNIEDLTVYFAGELASDLKNREMFNPINYFEVTLSEGHGQRGRIKIEL
ncbi:MAG: 6-carboxytetrahydropterin synthase [Deltaproteobacteria bacterium]|jgi:6-pyruvoyl-tetrahydropterin synthase|nr:6-carboxytetrahydropterin synthase [Deltaproteobacteria bacterium]MDA8298881.1 6-carboxytetrahydropterin synthase [Deltaproteobacteria bacterium]